MNSYCESCNGDLINDNNSYICLDCGIETEMVYRDNRNVKIEEILDQKIRTYGKYNPSLNKHSKYGYTSNYTHKQQKDLEKELNEYIKNRQFVGNGDYSDILLGKNIINKTVKYFHEIQTIKILSPNCVINGGTDYIQELFDTTDKKKTYLRVLDNSSDIIQYFTNIKNTKVVVKSKKTKIIPLNLDENPVNTINYYNEILRLTIIVDNMEVVMEGDELLQFYRKVKGYRTINRTLYIYGKTFSNKIESIKITNDSKKIKKNIIRGDNKKKFLVACIFITCCKLGNYKTEKEILDLIGITGSLKKHFEQINKWYRQQEITFKKPTTMKIYGYIIKRLIIKSEMKTNDEQIESIIKCIISIYKYIMKSKKSYITTNTIDGTKLYGITYLILNKICSEIDIKTLSSQHDIHSTTIQKFYTQLTEKMKTNNEFNKFVTNTYETIIK